MQSYAKQSAIGLPKTEIRPAEISQIRVKLGLDTKQMAELLRSRQAGITDNLYLRFEAGDSVPSKPTQAFLRELELKPELAKSLATS